MIRPSLRRLSTLALLLTLTVLFAAPAAAVPALPKEQPVAKEESGWWDTALNLLNKLLPEKALNLPLPKLPVLPLGGTGSCIDPMGNPCIFIPLF